MAEAVRRRVRAVDWGRAATWAVVAGALPVMRTWQYWFGTPRLPRTLMAIGAVLLAGLALQATSRLRIRHEVVLPIALGAGVLASAGGGRIVGVWAVAWVVLATWSVLERPPLRFVPRPDARARLPHLAAATIGALAIVSTNRDQLRIPTVALLGATVIAVQASWRFAVLDRAVVAVERCFALLGRMVATALLALVGMVATVPLWALARVTGWAPEARWRTPHRGWSPPAGAAEVAGRLWAPDPPKTSWWPRPRIVRTGALAAVVLVVATVVALAPQDDPGPEQQPAAPPPEGPRAWDGSAPWYGEYGRAFDSVLEGQELLQYAGLELPDVESRYLTIEGGWRHSWDAPDPTCGRRLTVWFMGGSAAYGELQRDDRTIAGELAKAAADDGFALDVLNGGVHGLVAWQEELRFQRALVDETERADLVLFYDGFNDYVAQDFSLQAGMGGRGTFMGINDSLIMNAINDLEQVTEDGASYFRAPVPDTDVLPRDVDAGVEAGLFQYRVSHERTVALAEREGMPMRRYFQPSLSTRDPAVPGDPPRQSYLDDAMAQLREGLPADVVDLADVLDDTDEPLYVDDVHPIEESSPAIAAAMYDDLRSTIRELAGDDGSCP